MAGKVQTYAFINAKLRARISNLLPEDFYRSLGKAHSFIEAMNLFHDTPYAELEAVYSRTGDLKMCELALFKREVEIFLEVENYVTGGPLGFVKALTTRYETEALKNVLRLWFERSQRGRNIESKVGYLFREQIHFQIPYDELLNARDMGELAEILGKTPYADLIREHQAEVEERRTLFPLEIAIDRYFYRQLLSAATKLERQDEEIARRLVGVQVDLENVNWVVRFKVYYELTADQAASYLLPRGRVLDPAAVRNAYTAEDPAGSLAQILSTHYGGASISPETTGGQTARLDLIEGLLQEILAHEVHRILGSYPFSIGIILAYFLLKQQELHRIVTLLNASYYGLSTERMEHFI